MRVPDARSANTSPNWIRHLFLHPIPLDQEVFNIEHLLYNREHSALSIVPKKDWKSRVACINTVFSRRGENAVVIRQAERRA
jgi:hypothetical protein